MAADQLPERWLLLLYTVPSQPSRKRALIWRELKKVGTVYLRDGVCALPECEAAFGPLQMIATKVHELGGQATLAEHCHLPLARARELINQLTQAREEEYDALTREVGRLFQHAERELRHRRFSSGEREQYAADFRKLNTWLTQIGARDYVGADGAEPARIALTEGELHLAQLLEDGGHDAQTE